MSASVCTSRMRLTMLVLAAPNLRASSLRSLVLWLVSQDDVVSADTVCVSSMCSILFASAVACSSLIVLPSPCASLDAFDSVVVYVVLSVPNSRCADSQSASAVACSPCWRRWDALTIGMMVAASNPAMARSATMTASAVLRRRCGGVSASPVNSALKRSRLSIGVFGRIVSHVAPPPCVSAVSLNRWDSLYARRVRGPREWAGMWALSAAQIDIRWQKRFVRWTEKPPARLHTMEGRKQ